MDNKTVKYILKKRALAPRMVTSWWNGELWTIYVKAKQFDTREEAEQLAFNMTMRKSIWFGRIEVVSYNDTAVK